jgi:NAD-dependent dihydropyrimidine dehydrogenase PreA subunit
MKKALFCHCAYTDMLSGEMKQEILSALANAKIELVEITDLCELAAAKDTTLLEHFSSGDVTVIACHPRAVRWLLHSAGVDRSAAVDILDMRANDVTSILKSFDSPSPSDTPHPFSISTRDWVPWFPVIDYSRCSNCRQCLNFCLFGVYEADEDGQVIVANPSNCKNNCPACARICPEIAIMFPKLNEEPLNGTEIIDETTERAKVKLNLDEILGNDAYAALAERRRKRQTMVVMKRNRKKAEEERNACSSCDVNCEQNPNRQS